jgi:hypothetical protein
MSFYCLECSRQANRGYYQRRRESEGFDYLERDDSPPGWKRCPGCRQTKPETEFHLNRTSKSGLVPYCKPCRRSRGRRHHLKKSYGLTEEQLAEKIEAQGGLCAICRRRPAEHVDHDHVLGLVRGVLCFPCNAALGQLKDNIQNFKNAIDYLERTTWQRTLVTTGVYRLTSPRLAAAASATSSELPRPTSSPRG